MHPLDVYLFCAAAWFIHRLNRFLERLVSEDDELMTHFETWPMFIGVAGACGLFWSAALWPYYFVKELLWTK